MGKNGRQWRSPPHQGSGRSPQAGGAEVKVKAAFYTARASVMWNALHISIRAQPTPGKFRAALRGQNGVTTATLTDHLNTRAANANRARDAFSLEPQGGLTKINSQVSTTQIRYGTGMVLSRTGTYTSPFEARTNASIIMDVYKCTGTVFPTLLVIFG